MTTSPITSVRGGSGAMFDAIAARYDLLNRILSLGIDRGWRKQTARALGAPERVLDLATGTGDLALEIARQHPRARIVGVDPSRGMLEIAKRKLGGSAGRIELREGDAQALPDEGASYDAVTIAFGIRNVPDRDRALREMARVTREGGRVAILELGEPRGILGPFARLHVHHVVPALGALLSGAAEYRYLERSIAAFPPPERFAAQMERAGLRVLEARPLTFGACTLFVAERPA